jgi:ACDE family multidrug resistance protein
MNWSRTGMFLSTAGLTLLVALLCLIMIHVNHPKSSKQDDSETQTLFKKFQLTTE